MISAYLYQPTDSGFRALPFAGEQAFLDLVPRSAKTALALTAHRRKAPAWRVEPRQELDMLVADASAQPCGERGLVH